MTVDGIAVSSTAVRERLARARCVAARRGCSGRPLCGGGPGRARRPPRPGARLPDRQRAPADRRAAARRRLRGAACEWGGERRDGVANVGRNPTFGRRRARTLEAHLFDFAGDLYGRALRVEFVERLRGEMKFASPRDARSSRSVTDAARAREVLKAERARCSRRCRGSPPDAARRVLGRQRRSSHALAGEELIDAGRVRVDGVARKAGYRARAAGSRSRWTKPSPPPRDASSRRTLPLDVLYEDADLLAIDKPAGMVVHPAPGAWRRHARERAPASRARVAASLRAAAGHRAPARPRHLGRAAGRAPRARAAGALSRAVPRAHGSKAYLAIVLGAPRSAAGRDRPADRPPSARAQAHVDPQPLGRARRARATRWSSASRL